MPELTVAANVACALIDLAVSKGASRRTLAEQSRIDPADLVDRDSRISFGRYVALMRAGQRLCGDPALALHFGETVDCSEFSIASALASVPSATIDDGFALVNRYARLGVEVDSVANGDRFQLDRRAGELWIVDARRNPNAFPELTESTFARMVCSTRRGLGATPFFKALHVTHAAPGYRAEYERIFRMPVVFGSPMNGLVLDEALTPAYRSPVQAPYVAAILKEHAERLLARLDATQPTRRRVEELLVAMLGNRTVSVERVARTLALSRHTLFRRLRSEHVTFEQVLDELRRSIALDYLSRSDVSVKQVSRLTGFSDPAAFSRAFKRWTGTRPSVYASRPTSGVLS
jgi:AraC-like DNA-binding protein